MTRTANRFGAPPPAVHLPGENQIGPERCRRLADRLWRLDRENCFTEEYWFAPGGGTMFGVSHTVQDGKSVKFEYLRIEQREDELIFTALPSGQSEASFTAVTVSDSLVVFANPEHDFPVRIIYQLLPNGSLLGRVVGELDGQTRSIDFPYHRIECN